MHKKVFNEKCNKTFSDVINAVYFNYLLALRSIDPAAKIGYLAKSPIDTSMSQLLGY